MERRLVCVGVRQLGLQMFLLEKRCVRVLCHFLLASRIFPGGGPGRVVDVEDFPGGPVLALLEVDWQDWVWQLCGLRVYSFCTAGRFSLCVVWSE